MAIEINQVDLISILRDIGNICKTEASCGTCADKRCLVGYARASAGQCLKGQVTYVENGVDDVPKADIRGGYDEYDVLHAIAHLLYQCKSCRDDHFSNCIINVVRSCFEVMEFGEEQEYQGEVLEYLRQAGDKFPEKTAIIMEEYTSMKNREQK